MGLKTERLLFQTSVEGLLEKIESYIKKEFDYYEDVIMLVTELYEADFNHNNKFLGYLMMKQAVDEKLISKEQYSTPGRRAIDHELNRRLIFDITRYQKTSLAMTSCNLKSCYDRISHTPAIMAMHRIGVPIEPASSMFQTIQLAQHSTRTAYGDSSMTYGGQEDFNAPVMGVGQGNGCGPQVWAAVSSAMFEVMKPLQLIFVLLFPKKIWICVDLLM